MTLSCRGFTLIELLVAMAISAVLAIMTYGGFQKIQAISISASAATGRINDVQMALRRLEQDLGQAAPRPVRDPVGDSYRPAVFGDEGQQYRLEFTRFGWANPLGLTRSTQERVAYYLDEDRLVRRHWLVLDGTLALEPVDTAILEGVGDFDIRFLGGSREWLPRWPPGGAEGPAALRIRPLAIEITLDIDGMGTIVRLIEVRG
jgi:general secretion pathway protein J